MYSRTEAHFYGLPKGQGSLCKMSRLLPVHHSSKGAAFQNNLGKQQHQLLAHNRFVSKAKAKTKERLGQSPTSRTENLKQRQFPSTIVVRLIPKRVVRAHTHVSRLSFVIQAPLSLHHGILSEPPYPLSHLGSQCHYA
jgi:hypothetical protein